jgi:glycerol uptake facilitator-like aquaporin
MNKQIAEFVGTFALVFFGCGAAVIGGMGSGPTAVDLLGIASAFGFAIVAMAYGIGPISGCHVNPAVSFGVYVAGRMSVADMLSYWVAQVLGAIVGAVVLYLILSGKAQGWTGGLGQNGWGAGYLGEYSVVSAFVFEVVATFLFLVCILGVTHPFAPTGFAGPRDRADAGRDPSRRHQRHRHLGQSGPLDRPGAGRDRREPRRGRAAMAVHHRAPDRRRRRGFPLSRRGFPRRA